MCRLMANAVDSGSPNQTFDIQHRSYAHYYVGNTVDAEDELQQPDRRCSRASVIFAHSLYSSSQASRKGGRGGQRGAKRAAPNALPRTEKKPTRSNQRWSLSGLGTGSGMTGGGLQLLTLVGRSLTNTEDAHAKS